jgi:Arc/MetJ-type ribon-helix-helix transcriptional regulator
MATRTFHISFPLEWAEEIEKKIEKEHYSVSEYFKELYREYRSDQEAIAALRESEEDVKQGRVYEGNLKDLLKRKDI